MTPQNNNITNPPSHQLFFFKLPEFIKRIPKEVIAERGWPSGENPTPMMQKARAPLPEIGETRLQSMDEAGISVQVLSVSGPGADLLPGAFEHLVNQRGLFNCLKRNLEK